MANFSKEEFTNRYLKSLDYTDRQEVFNYLADLENHEFKRLVEIGKSFYSSSAVNGIWFWRTLPVLAKELEQSELNIWLEEGVGVCRGDWESALAFLKASPEMVKCLNKASFKRWLQIGRHLVRVSTKEATHFFKNSLKIFKPIDQYEQKLLTHQTLKIIKGSWQAGAACLRAWPELSPELTNECKARVLELGVQLAEEFGEDAQAFFQSVLAFIQKGGTGLIGLWVDAAYVITNSKRGVIAAFFRFSPGFLEKTPNTSGQSLIEWVSLGNKLAEFHSKIAELFFEKTPEVLRYVELSCLKQWADLVERVYRESSFQGAIRFTENTPEILKELDLAETFIWVDFGLNKISADKALAYFGLKSQESREAIGRLRSGLFLDSVKKVLVLYCEGLTGETVVIRNASDLPEDMHGDDRLFGTLDTRRFYLPPVVKLFEDDHMNLRFYRIMLIHMVSHKLYGSFDLSMDEIEELINNPVLGFIYEYFEDARVDYLAVKNNPGLARDMKLLLEHESCFDGELVFENLLLKFINYLINPVSESLLFKQAMGQVDIYWKDVLDTGGCAEKSLKVARSLLELAEGEPINNLQSMKFRYRGTFCFSLLYKSMELDEEIVAEEDIKINKLSQGNLHNEYYQRLKKLLYAFYEDEVNPYRMTAFYDEWDRTLNDYKKDWCKVREILLKPSTGRIVTQTLNEHRGMVDTLKRYFGMLRPDRFRRYRRQNDGEEIDIDSVVETMVEVEAGATPAGGFYIKRDKRERDVAVGFLLDLSYSTEEVISGTGKTLLDVETESVVVMAEALEVLGDKYAIYGFNSDSRDKVNFYVVKDFEEEYNFEVKQRFGGLQSYGMTRLGSAIRHAVFKMEKIQAAVKIIIVLSDGRPFDFDYNSGLTNDYEAYYPEADTRMALREAKMKGVNPFCITVDSKGQDYLEYIFGNVNYIIIDDIQALPTKLTETYKNLTT